MTGAQQIPDELREFVEPELAAGRCESIDDMQLAGLRLLKWKRDDALAGVYETRRRRAAK